MNAVIIHTDRLTLKGISPQVVNEIFNSKTENEIRRLFGADDKEYQRLKEMHEKGMETHRYSLFFFILIKKDTDQPIGQCGFHTLNSTHKRAELFYFLNSEEHKKKGLMTEALAEVIKYGFQNLELHRIQALIASWNEPSIKLVKNWGFKFEGTMREDYVVNDKCEDSDCYSLLRHEWNSRVAQE